MRNFRLPLAALPSRNLTVLGVEETSLLACIKTPFVVAVVSTRLLLASLSGSRNAYMSLTFADASSGPSLKRRLYLVPSSNTPPSSASAVWLTASSAEIVFSLGTESGIVSDTTELPCASVTVMTALVAVAPKPSASIVVATLRRKTTLFVSKWPLSEKSTDTSNLLSGDVMSR